MTRTAEYGVPEGNQDRDEWMTAIEVQEYMEASRSKAYGLAWSGEIDSYKLDRKPLVSRASVDAYIESRSGGNDGVDRSETARRRMHTGTSRRKEFKDTQRHRAGDGFELMAADGSSRRAVYQARRRPPGTLGGSLKITYFMKCRFGWTETTSELITESGLADTQAVSLNRKPDEHFRVFLEASVLFDAEDLDLWNHTPRARHGGRLNDGSGGIFLYARGSRR